MINKKTVLATILLYTALVATMVIVNASIEPNKVTSSDDIVYLPHSMDFMIDNNTDFEYFIPQQSQLGQSYKTVSAADHADSNVLWKTGYTSQPETISSSTIVLRNVILESYEQMPRPPEQTIEKYLKKLESPKKRVTPYLHDDDTTAEIPQDAIMVDATLDTPYDNGDPRIKSVVESGTTMQKIDYTTNTVPADLTILISEPAAATHKDAIFVTGNWWASRSSDGGSTFSFVDPYNFPGFDRFCCDQDVVYNEEHDVWIWYRQGGGVANHTPVNVGKFGISTNDAYSWCFFDLSPTDIDRQNLADFWFDFPHMQTTDDKLYFTSNIYHRNVLKGGAVTDQMVYSAILRFDLQGLKNCNDTSFDSYVSSEISNLVPTNGATDTMYIGSKTSTSQIRILQWQDSSTLISFADAGHMGDNQAAFSCVLDIQNTNPCGKLDGRILGGYLAKDVIGFVWDSAQSDIFSFPFVNHLRVDGNTGRTIDNPIIYSDTAATSYPSISANEEGDVAITFFRMGSLQKPAVVIGIDEYDTPKSDFEFVTVKTSTHNPLSSNKWGDYLRIKQHAPFDGTWVSTGFTLQGGTHPLYNMEILLTKFGRELIVAPPVITSPVDQAVFAHGNITVAGTADPLTAIRLFNDTTDFIGTTDTLGNKTTWLLPVILDDGRYSMTATATKDAETSIHSNAVFFTVDASYLPASPVIVSPVAKTYHTSSITFAGTGVASSLIKIYDDDKLLADATADDNGAWSVTKTLDDGIYFITATATNEYGTSAASGTINIIIDLTPASVAGTVYADANNNGVRDNTDETGIADVTIIIIEMSNIEERRTVTTNADGTYKFEDLSLGNFLVQVTPFPKGHKPANDTRSYVFVTIRDGTTNMVDFPLLLITEDNAATVAGKVFNDANNDGVLDADEKAGFPKVTIFVVDLLTMTQTTVTTDSDGYYIAKDVIPDTVLVQMAPVPVGFLPSDGFTSFFYPLLQNGAESTINFPLNKVDAAETGTVNIKVFHDKNENGIKDAIEPPVQHATVFTFELLTANSDVKTTDVNGVTIHSGLIPDVVLAQINASLLPLGFTKITTPNLGAEFIMVTSGSTTTVSIGLN